MQRAENFICLEYSDIDIIISQKVALSAVCCDSRNFVKDKDGNDKTIFNSEWIPFVNIDRYVSKTVKIQDTYEIKTCIIVHNKSLYENEQYFGLVTAADCKVKEFDFSVFSVFSELYNKFLEKKGIIACRFTNKTDSKIGYLVDIERFLAALSQKAGVQK